MTIVTRTLEEVKKRAAARPRRSLKPWSDEKIEKAARSDPDAWLPTEEELGRFKPVAKQSAAATELAEDSRPYAGGRDKDE